MSQIFSEPIPSTVTCSSRLLKALEIFVDLGMDKFLPTEKGLEIDGRTFPFIVKGHSRSREWVEHIQGKGFRLTAKGWAAYQCWTKTNVYRTTPATQFAKAIQGLRGLNGEFNRVVVMKKRRKTMQKEQVNRSRRAATA